MTTSFAQKPVVLVCLVVIVAGCGQTLKDTYINAMIEAGTPHCEQLAREQAGLFESVEIRRDARENGVVIEHVFVDGSADIPRDIKASAVNGMKKSGSWNGVKTVLEADVYLKIIFRKSDGTVVGEEIISKDDV